jgi:uncharacterized protein YbjT (DUF2867 family)
MKDKASETKNKNMKIVVIGGTGLIGSKVVNILRQRGHEVVPASPSSGVNTLTGWTSSKRQVAIFFLRKSPPA